MAKLLLALNLLLVLVGLCSAEITTVKISSDDRPIILFERFGFTRSGCVAISVSSVSAVGSPDQSRMGFFLLSELSLIAVLEEFQSNPSFCVLDSRYVNPLFTFRDLSPPPASSFNDSYPVTYPTEYSLFFANCGGPESTVSMDVTTELYSIYGGEKDYLPAGLTKLPLLYFISSFLYISFFTLWAYECSKRVKSVQAIHLLMGLLVIVKALNLLFAAEYNRSVKAKGTTPHGWEVLVHLFQLINGVLWFTVVVLIGSGWSFPNHFLQKKGTKALMVIIPLQVLASVSLVVIGKTGPFMKDWVALNQFFLLVDIIGCFAVVFSIFLSVRDLRREASKAGDGKAAKNLEKSTILRGFLAVVIGYLFFARIVVFALRTFAGYEHLWVANAAEEIAGLAFYYVIFYMFRPVEEKKEEEGHYILLDGEDQVAVKG